MNRSKLFLAILTSLGSSVISAFMFRLGWNKLSLRKLTFKEAYFAVFTLRVAGEAFEHGAWMHRRDRYNIQKLFIDAGIPAELFETDLPKRPKSTLADTLLEAASRAAAAVPEGHKRMSYPPRSPQAAPPPGTDSHDDIG